MTEPSRGLAALRVAVDTWNAACVAASYTTENGPTRPRRSLLPPDPGPEPEVDWAALVDAGVASEPGTLVPQWKHLLTAWADSPIVFRFTSTYRGLAYEAVLAVGELNVCVLTRSRTEPAPDGTLRKVAHDPHLEVAVSTEHPWTLVRRVLPPLGALRAAPRRTPADATHALTVPDDIRDAVVAALEANPGLSAAEALRAADVPPRVEAALGVQASTSWLVTAAAGERVAVGLGCYVASDNHVYRASFGADVAWEEVEPGDLGYSVAFHLLGALDAVRRHGKGSAA